MLKNLFNSMPVVTKNLFLLNILVFIVLLTGGSEFYGGGYKLNDVLGMHYFGSVKFEPYQVITHLFCHGDPFHLFFNMFALIMFGAVLERVWGPKRFFIFYFICGFGAVALHMIVAHIEIQNMLASPSDATIELANRLHFPDVKSMIQVYGSEILDQGQNFSDPYLGSINTSYNITMVGASGAIYGLLIGFGMLFPNEKLMLMFFPVPIRAKYFIPGLILIELFLGVKNFEVDNVAHFAHLGGALFGFILIKIWNRNRNRFY